MSTYATLQTDVLRVLRDTQVDNDPTIVQDFIRRAEFKLQRDLLSDQYGGGVPRQMLVRSTGQTTGTSTYPLPADYEKARSVVVGPNAARFAPPELVAPESEGFAEADVTLDYYQRLPVLSVTSPTNWLLSVGFDCYLWAACLQYLPWGHESTDLGGWTQYYSDALRTLKQTHSARPRGGFSMKKTKRYGAYYTVIGSDMLFGRAY